MFIAELYKNIDILIKIRTEAGTKYHVEHGLQKENVLIYSDIFNNLDELFNSENIASKQWEELLEDTDRVEILSDSSYEDILDIDCRREYMFSLIIQPLEGRKLTRSELDTCYAYLETEDELMEMTSFLLKAADAVTHSDINYDAGLN